MNVKELSDNELKALAYEQLKERERAQVNINIIEAELESRMTPVDKQDTEELAK